MKKAIQAFFLSASLAVMASPSSAVTLDDEDRALIVKDTVEFFKENPGELVEAIIEWRQKTAKETIAEALPQPVTGNRNADIVIFEFADYGCEPCVRNSRVIDAAVKEDGNLLVVHYDLPLSGKDAISASLEIIAASRVSQDWHKLREFYLREGVSPEARLKAMDLIRVNPNKLNLSGAMQTIRENRDAARASGILELPAIVISANDTYYPIVGEISEQDLKNEIGKIRAGN